MVSDNFNGFTKHLKLSDVKELLLQKLWNSGSSFPRNWVKSSDLLKLTNQKYFDRRLRELRDSGGLDLETKVIDGEHCWRLASLKIATAVNRTYLSATQKQSLFQRSGFRCAICGKETKAGVRGLQADHKIPLSRGGSEALSNWQPICNECNVAKRRLCQDCTLDCQSCSWAFPERGGRKILVTLSSRVHEHHALKHLDDHRLAEWILRAVEQQLD